MKGAAVIIGTVLCCASNVSTAAQSAYPTRPIRIVDAFPPGAKRDYIVWLEEAKTDATRSKRLETAVEWISEGKHRHWKYQKK